MTNINKNNGPEDMYRDINAKLAEVERIIDATFDVYKAMANETQILDEGIVSKLKEHIKHCGEEAEKSKNPDLKAFYGVVADMSSMNLKNYIDFINKHEKHREKIKKMYETYIEELMLLKEIVEECDLKK